MSVTKWLEFVRTDVEKEKSWDRAVEKLSSMSRLDIVNVWLELLNTKGVSDPNEARVLMSQRKMLLRAALSDAYSNSTMWGSGGCGDSNELVEGTLARCIPLCEELQNAFIEIANTRDYANIREADTSAESRDPILRPPEIGYENAGAPDNRQDPEVRSQSSSRPPSSQGQLSELWALLKKCCDEQKAHQLAMDARLDAMERKLDAIATTRLDVLEQKLDAIAATRLEIPLVAAQQMQERVNEMGRGLDKHVQDMEAQLTVTIANELKKARDTAGDELKQLQAHLDERINNVNTSIEEKFGLVQKEMESMRAEVRTEMDHMHDALEQVPEAPAAAEGGAGGAPAAGVSPETSANSIGRRGAPRLRRASSESPSRNSLLPFRAGVPPDPKRADNALYRGDPPVRSAFDYELEPWDT